MHERERGGRALAAAALGMVGKLLWKILFWITVLFPKILIFLFWFYILVVSQLYIQYYIMFYAIYLIKYLFFQIVREKRRKCGILSWYLVDGVAPATSKFPRLVSILYLHLSKLFTYSMKHVYQCLCISFLLARSTHSSVPSVLCRRLVRVPRVLHRLAINDYTK